MTTFNLLDETISDTLYESDLVLIMLENKLNGIIDVEVVYSREITQEEILEHIQNLEKYDDYDIIQIVK